MYSEIYSVILAVSVTVIWHLMMTKIKKINLLRDAKLLCKNLRVILQDYDYNNEEEEYDVDLSLKSYFNDKHEKILDIANELRKRQSYFLSTDKKLYDIGDLLEWLVQDFYKIHDDEDIRIKRWSQMIENLK